jgi:hypothetical protein
MMCAFSIFLDTMGDKEAIAVVQGPLRVHFFTCLPGQNAAISHLITSKRCTSERSQEQLLPSRPIHPMWHNHPQNIFLAQKVQTFTASEFIEAIRTMPGHHRLQHGLNCFLVPRKQTLEHGSLAAEGG